MSLITTKLKEIMKSTSDDFAPFSFHSPERDEVGKYLKKNNIRFDFVDLIQFSADFKIFKELANDSNLTFQQFLDHVFGVNPIEFPVLAISEELKQKATDSLKNEIKLPK